MVANGDKTEKEVDSAPEQSKSLLLFLDAVLSGIDAQLEMSHLNELSDDIVSVVLGLLKFVRSHSAKQKRRSSAEDLSAVSEAFVKSFSVLELLTTNKHAKNILSERLKMDNPCIR